jgi:F-type H+-transporting ATPase subunit b
MKRAAWLLIAFGMAAFAQLSKTGETEGGGLEAWKWVNFVVLAGGLGYLVGKSAGPLFAARSRKIRQDMLDAEDARQEAEARVAEVDRRLADLEADIAALRLESQREAQSEIVRIQRQTAAEIGKIQAHAQREIAAAAKAARSELKRYAAELALSLAEQKIRACMTPQAEDALVRGFVSDLRRPESRAQTN